MAKDVRALRDEAAEANAAGKYKRALVAYLELERLESRDAQWPKRAAETLRRLGKDREAIEAYARSSERYAQSGFLVQAMAVCKIILQIDPQHASTLRALAQMNEQVGAGPTRAANLADNNPMLHQDANVAAIRRGSNTDTSGLLAGVTAMRPRTRTTQPPLAPITPPGMPPVSTRNRSNTAPPLAQARTKSRPISLPYNSPIDAINLSREIPLSFETEQPGVHVIAIDEVNAEVDDAEIELTEEAISDEQPVDEEELVLAEPDEPDEIVVVDEGDDDHEDGGRSSIPVIEIEPPDADEPIEADVEYPTELELADLEDIPLPEPRALAAAAARALAMTPLFAGLPKEALEALVEELQLISLDVGEVLFREGDPGDALYVIAEGEVSIQAEGPPRVEMARHGAGTFLGEVALMTDQPRSATVIAVTEAELLRIDRNTLGRVLVNHGEVLGAVLRFVRDRLVDRWMRTSPLFRPFSDEERASIAAKFQFLEIDPGTQLLGAGQRPDGLYIVLAGRFIVQRDDKLLAQLGPGDLIGETALLEGGKFLSNVTAHHKSLALCLPASDFREMIMIHPHVLEYVGEHAEQSRRLQIL
ncbi:MAG: cyclic nucleotide-binding domain-containing protein [Proteobacteria bacterium]|nr:cyclic nucleotide-binding domain-containing protein [Pseudomonadota bacterium]